MKIKEEMRLGATDAIVEGDGMFRQYTIPIIVERVAKLSVFIHYVCKSSHHGNNL